MKLSLKWLKEFVDLPGSITPEQLAYDLTMSTVEVESLIDLSAGLKDICVAEVKEIKKHPNADKLVLVQTDIGKEVKEIVCGGTNLEEGARVAVSLPGAQVRWHGKGDLVEVKKAKIRGVESYGMICASSEIGLGTLFPAEKEAEIIKLTGLDAKPGEALSSVIGYDDFVIEIDNKSLTNRPDLWGHYGIARELAAIYSCPLKELDLMAVEFLDQSDALEIVNKAKDYCPRFTALVFDQVENSESPFWLKSALSRVGQKSINFLADLTNYVMFGIGRPTHVFDYEKIEGSKLIIRKAKKSEELVLLDKTKLELDADSYVVSDSKKALALAGITGGLKSGVTADTKKIIFEAGSWNPTSIRRVANRFGVRTDSSMRFEKGLDHFSTELGTRMLGKLLAASQPEAKLVAAVQSFDSPPKPVQIEVEHSFIESRLGQSIESSLVVEKLEKLGFSVEQTDSKYQVLVPNWRATGDISIKEDIVEEIARIIGYDNLRFSAIPVGLAQAVEQPAYQLERYLRTYLAYSARLQEIYSYPWVSDKYLNALSLETKKSHSLADPPDPKQAKIRTSLAPGMLEAIGQNLRFFDNFGLYEVGRVFLSSGKSSFSKNKESLAYQPKKLLAALVGSDAKELFLEAKGIFEEMLALRSLKLSFASSDQAWLPTEGQLKLNIDGTSVGQLGIVSSVALKKAGISKAKVVFVELDLTELAKIKPTQTPYQTIPRFPQVEYDLAVLFDSNIAWQDIEQTVLSCDKTIKSVNFQDEYQGNQVPEGKKSLAFRMLLSNPEATLSSDQVSSIADGVLGQLKKKLGWRIKDFISLNYHQN